jgi:heterotetrameric sarcosine oxidase gamma subunit
MAEALMLRAHPGAGLAWSAWRRAATLQGPEPELQEWAEERGLGWPALMQASVAGDHALLRLGPAELAFLVAGEGNVTPMRRMVQNGAGFLALEMLGPASEEWLASGVPIDLERRAFPVGMATRTVLGKVEINLWRMDEQRFRIECGRSFLPHLLGFLAESAG